MFSCKRSRFSLLLAIGLALGLPAQTQDQREERELEYVFIRQLVDFTAIAIDEMDPKRPEDA